MFLSGFCFSKYQEQKEFLLSSEIAIPIFVVEQQEKVFINSINSKGKCEFIVKNYEEDLVSDVAFKYTIEIISNLSNYISFNLYKDSQKIQLSNNKTEDIYIENNEKNSHKYILEVMYNDFNYLLEKDILENIKIKVYAEQK